MAQLTEAILVERLQALREPPPDDGFSARLRERLEREAESRKIVPLRPRVRRSRMVLLIAAAIPLAALAAAAAGGWAPFTSAPEAPRKLERKVILRRAAAPRPSAVVKPPAPTAIQPAPVAPSLPAAPSERVRRPAASSAPPRTEVAPSVEPEPAPAPSASAPTPARVERVKIETRAAERATERRELRQRGHGKDRVGAGEQRQRRRDESGRGERREQRRNKAGGGQGHRE